jgi:hypothetical protein
MFGTPNLKTNIIKRLKTFSQIKSQYNTVNEIYRSGKRKYFSEIAKKYNLEGLPNSRPTKRLYEDESYENTKKDEDILEPIWYSAELEASQGYCRGITDCATYAYTPLDSSLIKKTKLVFLDLTDFSGKVENEVVNGKNIKKYRLFQPLMAQMYNYIFEKYRDQIVSDGNEKYMCVDNPCNSTFTIEEIISAYGGYYGFRNSEGDIDRFITMELFQIVKDLNIEKEQNCIVMGYYHADLIVGNIDEQDKKTPFVYEGGHFPAEFTIKYGYSINKNCIEFKGEMPSEKEELGVEKRKRGGTKNKKKIKKNKKTIKTIKNNKNKKEL